MLFAKLPHFACLTLSSTRFKVKLVGTYRRRALIKECTALVWVPRPVLPATQVESKVDESEPVISAEPRTTGLTRSEDSDAGNHCNYAEMKSSKLDVFIRNRVPQVLRL